MDSEKINIKSLRKFVDDKFARDSVLRDLILGEPNQIGVEEFLAKMEIWLRLLQMESNKGYCGERR